MVGDSTVFQLFLSFALLLGANMGRSLKRATTVSELCASACADNTRLAFVRSDLLLWSSASSDYACAFPQPRPHGSAARSLLLCCYPPSLRPSVLPCCSPSLSLAPSSLSPTPLTRVNLLQTVWQCARSGATMRWLHDAAAIRTSGGSRCGLCCSGYRAPLSRITRPCGRSKSRQLRQTGAALQDAAWSEAANGSVGAHSHTHTHAHFASRRADEHRSSCSGTHPPHRPTALTALITALTALAPPFACMQLGILPRKPQPHTKLPEQRTSRVGPRGRGSLGPSSGHHYPDRRMFSIPRTHWHRPGGCIHLRSPTHRR